MTERTGAARRLLSFATAEFGEYLSGLLLSGYGVDQIVLRRRYVVSLQDDGGQEITVEVATDDSKGLPAGWEPLVLLALLKLLPGGRSLTVTVSYSLRELLKKLGLTAGDGRAVERAIEGYYDLSFIKYDAIEPSLREFPPARMRVLRPIIEWEREEETVGGNRLIIHKGGQVKFNPDFVEQLKGRSLLGIEWQRVQGLRVEA